MLQKFGIQKSEVHFIKPVFDTKVKVPLFLSRVEAGFPSPADDYIEDSLDLNKYLIKKPAATFFVKTKGDSMINAGIEPGDLLIIDRSLDPKHNAIVIAMLNGTFTVKRLIKRSNQTLLHPENPKYRDIEIKPEHDFEIWGVVAHVIKSFK